MAVEIKMKIAHTGTPDENSGSAYLIRKFFKTYHINVGTLVAYVRFKDPDAIPKHPTTATQLFKVDIKPIATPFADEVQNNAVTAYHKSVSSANISDITGPTFASNPFISEGGNIQVIKDRVDGRREVAIFENAGEQLFCGMEAFGFWIRSYWQASSNSAARTYVDDINVELEARYFLL